MIDKETDDYLVRFPFPLILPCDGETVALKLSIARGEEYIDLWVGILEGKHIITGITGVKKDD